MSANGNMERGASGAPPSEGRNGNSMPSYSSSGTVQFRPNNYRRQITAHDLDEGAISAIARCYSKISHGKHNKLIFVRDHERVLIQVGKRTVTGIWRQRLVNGVKESFELKGDQIRDKVELIRQEIDGVLLSFCDSIGLVGYGEPMWSWHEDGLQGERYIDSLPKDLILQTPIFTKLYGEGIEFKGRDDPGVHAEHYIRNRAVEDIAPAIAKELEMIRRAVMRGQPLIEAQELISRYPEDIVREDVCVLISRMTEREHEALSEWTFKRFGGRA